MGRDAHQAAKRLRMIAQRGAKEDSALPPRPSHLENLTLKCKRLNVLWT